ncbi:hypothetical protein BDV41DRAFT_554873 [Aspergillus transmontanensis]|uniref:Uncharacterized protein n=1 Tax=Aspergillus transmontanensis TaxID=1034304 RepID=A0A5N6VGB0_9EURO|nr:hypothetical protein BDV41DRAFT_554873 [Aspergillus transmontanensis]
MSLRLKLHSPKKGAVFQLFSFFVLFTVMLQLNDTLNSSPCSRFGNEEKRKSKGKSLETSVTMDNFQGRISFLTKSFTSEPTKISKESGSCTVMHC